MDKINMSQPKDWLEGLKENFSSDLSSGFVVFLLALPLSLGIAQASGIPPLMGIISAIVGGVLVTFITGCKLAIKGPAAGLIVIVAGAVSEFGGDEIGWKLAAGAMVAAGIVQILFGLIKLGKYVDFFPLSAIHGMLAAIGLIIIAKQVPVLLNTSPELSKGMGPFELFSEIPTFIANLDPSATFIGIVSLLLMIFWPKIKNGFLSKIPAPLVVLLFAIPAGMLFEFSTIKPSYTLVKVGNLIDSIAINADFSGVSHLGIFVKYVVMFALVGSLESLLTVKAIDLLDPFKRKSDPNKDLIAVGIGNTLVAFLGGYPMISEVARSSANIKNGAKTRWANFFHGSFLLIFVLVAYPVLEMIPNAALAAMLISVGINLAHPKEFVHMYEIGKDQLAIFLTTIVFTLVEDLLIGIAAGILLKIVMHLIRGVKMKSLFKSSVVVTNDNDSYVVEINDSAVFSNYLGFKKYIDQIPEGKKITVLLSESVLLMDHSFIDDLYRLQYDYELANGVFLIEGFQEMKPISSHKLSVHIR
ncbi:MAG: sulfate transporter [Bacteroidetes bacterium]|nr:MAG: sulfate transporter [Bacteroidota bacterium]